MINGSEWTRLQSYRFLRQKLIYIQRETQASSFEKAAISALWSLMKGVGHHRERALMAIGRTKLGLPAVLFGFLFFIALLLGPVLFIFKDSSGDAALTRSRLMEMSDDETELRAMPHGLSGESHASSIPFQVLGFLNSIRLSSVFLEFFFKSFSFG